MMLCCCPELRTRIQTWLRDYDKIQSFAVILIYIQIGCALIGSLGALYNGVLLIIDLMDLLREIPGREALKLRAEAASMASQLHQQKTAVDKRVLKISEFGVSV